MIKGLLIGLVLHFASYGFIGTVYSYTIVDLSEPKQTFVLCNGDYVDVATLINPQIDFIYEINPIVGMGIVVKATDSITNEDFTCDLSTSIYL